MSETQLSDKEVAVVKKYRERKIKSANKRAAAVGTKALEAWKANENPAAPFKLKRGNVIVVPHAGGAGGGGWVLDLWTNGTQLPSVKAGSHAPVKPKPATK